MDYGEINKYLKQSIDKKIRKSPDKEMFKNFKNKIESHTIHEYKFLHYLDNIPIDEDMCDMEDNFLVSCYNEYIYQHRNNILKSNKPIYDKIEKTVINFLPKAFLSKQFLSEKISPNRTIQVSGFGKKS